MTLFCTAAVIAAEIGCSSRTVLAKAREMERDGVEVIAKIGKPTQINRERFMRHLFPGWTEGEE